MHTLNLFQELTRQLIAWLTKAEVALGAGCPSARYRCSAVDDSPDEQPSQLRLEPRPRGFA